VDKVLYLVQRIPYPPDKGDKIASFNILKYLSRYTKVYLATFADDPADLAHIGKLREYCEDVIVVPLNPLWAKVRALPRLLGQDPLTLGYFYDKDLARWIDRVVESEGITKSLVFCSAMAQYLSGDKYRDMTRFAHYVDIDSDKWAQYAEMTSGLKRWVYGREAKTLEAFEKKIAREFDGVGLVAPFETQQFQRLVPDIADRIKVIQNGTDTGYFSPDHAFDTPYETGEIPIVFTGAMDYFPNADAVSWFAHEILPSVQKHVPSATFYIVGSNPGKDVLNLRNLPNVKVTGRVPDVRPYLRYAALSVAPLRAARGIQNKALEAMAMGRMVICTVEVQRGMAKQCASLVMLAKSPEEFAAAVLTGLTQADQVPTSAKLRAAVIAEYSWDANLAQLHSFLKIK
jgi:sugar transferase (PEP-CTERM/EpsH1 system associated)